MIHHTLSYATAAIASAMLLTLPGCADQPPTAVYSQTNTLLSRVELDVGAVTIPVNGTQPLHVTAYLADGTKESNVTDVTYKSSTPSRVSVSPDGVITGLFITDQPVAVTASIQRDSITRSVQVLVKVTDTAAVASRFTFAIDADSAVLALWDSGNLLGVVQTPSGDTLRNLPVKYWAADPRVAIISGSQVIGQGTGTTRLYATTTAYGTTFTDSLDIKVNYATAISTFYYYGQWGALGSGLGGILQPGGTFKWYNTWNGANGDLMGITFDNPAAALPDPAKPEAGGGNIAPFRQGNVARQFVTPGSYTWTATDAAGTVKGTGVIIVKPTAGL
jgi:hypothetical protein